MVHEYIFPDRNPNHVLEESKDFEIRHYPDEDKVGSRYDSLIKDEFDEDPTSHRYQMYYAKTLFETNPKEAAKQFKKYIKMDNPQRLATDICSAYIALSLLEPSKSKKHLKSAIKTWNAREPLISLAIYYFNKKKWKKAAKYCKKTLEITQRTTDHNYLEYAWSYLPKNMLYVANHNSKFKNRKDKMSLNLQGMTSSSFDLFTKD
jgi:tetratricopeptide (TPR) repeat protein